MSKLLKYCGFLFLTLQSFSCLSYISHVSSNQISILWHRRKIADVIADNDIKPEIKRKLELIKVVERFAVEQLSLKDTQSYSYYTQIDRNYVAWNVSASHKLKFEAYTWWFPFAGTVPYKGFFDKDYAKEQYLELKEEGYDARMRPVPAYSTLGWFSDPILSSFLRGSESSLIELIIHEMSHATFYIKGDTTFNESFASFIEEVGTKKYYKQNSLPKKLKRYIDSNKDYRTYITLMKNTAIKLDKVYKGQISDKEKLRQKNFIISSLKKRVVSDNTIFRNQRYQDIFKRELNNANFQSILRYQSGGAVFQKIYQQNNQNMKKFLAAIKNWQDYDNKKRHELMFGK